MRVRKTGQRKHWTRTHECAGRVKVHTRCESVKGTGMLRVRAHMGCGGCGYVWREGLCVEWRGCVGGVGCVASEGTKTWVLCGRSEGLSLAWVCQE